VTKRWSVKHDLVCLSEFVKIEVFNSLSGVRLCRPVNSYRRLELLSKRREQFACLSGTAVPNALN